MSCRYSAFTALFEITVVLTSETAGPDTPRGVRIDIRLRSEPALPDGYARTGTGFRTFISRTTRSSIIAVGEMLGAGNSANIPDLDNESATPPLARTSAGLSKSLRPRLRSGLGDVNATLVDRFGRSASQMVGDVTDLAEVDSALSTCFLPSGVCILSAELL